MGELLPYVTDRKLLLSPKIKLKKEFSESDVKLKIQSTRNSIFWVKVCHWKKSTHCLFSILNNIKKDIFNEKSLNFHLLCDLGHNFLHA